MKWVFPLINPVKYFSLRHYIDHVKEEVQEFENAASTFEAAKEVVDVLHAAETLARKFVQRHPEVDLDEIVKITIEKNLKRGYYSS